MRTAFLIAALIAAVLLGHVGCDGHPSTSQPSTAPAGNLTFRDAAGGVVATGTIVLPHTLPASGETFEGTWQLISSNAGFPSGATRNGTCQGHVYDEWISIDLNPGMADNNVVFHWSPTTRPITGPWYHATDAGGEQMGTFTMTWLPGDVP